MNRYGESDSTVKGDTTRVRLDTLTVPVGVVDGLLVAVPVCQRRGRDPGLPFYDEAACRVVLVGVGGLFLEWIPFIRRQECLFHLVVQLGSFGRVLEHVVGVGVGDEPFPGDGYGDLGYVDGDPAPSLGLGLEGHGPGAAGEVQHQVPWICGHQDAVFEDLGRGFHHVLFVLCPWSVCPNYCDVSPRDLVLIFLPTQSPAGSGN